MREIQQGQFYRHFKDRLYQIVAVAEHSETGERLVVYQALYGDYRVYARPYDMFVSEVDHEKYPEVRQRYRFELVEFTAKETPEEASAQPEAATQPKAPARPEAASKPKAPVQPEAVSEPKAPASKPQSDEEEAGVNPILLEFLEADTLEEKMHIMIFRRNQMDDELLNSIAISLDLVVEKETVQQKYDEIMNCLSMMKKFECSRFR